MRPVLFRFWCWAVAFLAGQAVLGSVVWAAEKLENTAEHREKLAEQKKYPEAYAAYKEALAADPENEEILFNTGLMAYLAGKPEASIAPWQKLKKLAPDDLLIRSKLVQAFEATGDKKSRDAERADILKLRGDGKVEAFKRAKFYCRDQFVVGGQRVMVFEHFDLQGERAVRFSFNLLEADEQNVKAKYSLGSYEGTNRMAREAKELKEGERLFHLDAYLDGGKRHETHGFFKGEPAYDLVKEKVVAILNGKGKPLSSSETK